MTTPNTSCWRHPPCSSLPHPGRGSALTQSLRFWFSGMNGLSTTVVGGGFGGGVEATAGAPDNASTATSASSTTDQRVTVRFYQRPLRSRP